jgi:hydrogenase maturation protease
VTAAAADTLVVGIGNRFRSDDAAGLEVASRLARSGVRAVEHAGEPIDLLFGWAGVERVVLVDAVRSGAAAGTVHRLDALATPLPRALFATSTHALGVAEAVELARALGRLPPSLSVYGIEGMSFAAGLGLSAPVAAAVDVVVAELGASVRAASRSDAGCTPEALRKAQ